MKNFGLKGRNEKRKKERQMKKGDISPIKLKRGSNNRARDGKEIQEGLKPCFIETVGPATRQ